MQEIKCPNCGKIFQVDEAGYAAIVRQVRDKEFEKEIAQREQAYSNEKDSAVKVAVTETRSQNEKALADKDRKLAEKDLEIARLKSQIEITKSSTDLTVQTAVQEREKEILELQNQLRLESTQWELREKSLSEQHAAELRQKDEEIAYYVDRFRPFDKAGGYGIQEWIGYAAIEKINGSFYNVMGLPIQKVYTELDKFLK